MHQSSDADIERLLADRGWLERLARGLVRDPATAEDLTQDTLVRAMEHGSIRSTSRHAVRGWLASVLRRLAIERHRSDVRRRTREEAVAPFEAGDCDALERALLRRDIVDAVLRLDEPERSAITLRYLDDLSYVEIATRQDSTESAVRQRVSRGLARLRRRLDEQPGGRAAWLTAVLPWIPEHQGLSVGPTGTDITQWIAMKTSTKVTAAAVVLLLGGAGLSAWLRPPAVEERTAVSERARADVLAGSPSEALVSVAGPDEPARVEVETGAVTGALSMPKSDAPPSLTTLIITDDVGEPLEGVSVAALVDGEHVHRTTDAMGRCQVPLPTEETSLHVFAEKEGHFHTKAFMILLKEISLVLPRTTTLRGRVEDAEGGAAVAGASVKFIHSTCKRCEPDVVTTAANGTFELLGIPVARPVTVSVESEGFGTTYERFTIPDPNQPAVRTLRVHRTIAVRLRVVDAQSGSGVGDAVLLPLRTPVNSDGSFVMKVVPGDQGRMHLTARAPGYCESRKDVLLDKVAEFEIPLVRGAVLEGFIRDEAGTPLPGVTIRFSIDHYRTAISRQDDAKRSALLPAGWRLDDGGEMGWTVSDDAGHYRREALVPFTYYSAFVHDGRFKTASFEIDELEGPDAVTTFDVSLVALPDVEPASWTGVLRLNGEPIGGGLRLIQGERADHVRVTPVGAFVIEGLLPGTVKILAIPVDRLQGTDYRAFASDFSIDMVVAAGERIERDIEFDLLMAPITGRVVTSDGKPVEGVTVALNCASPRFHINSVSDALGAFRCDVPADRGLSFVARVEYGRESVTQEDIAPGADDVMLVVPNIGTLRVRAIDADTGHGVDDWMLYWRRAASGRFDQLTRPGWRQPLDVDGWLETTLAAGRFDLMARRTNGGAVVIASTTLAVGETRDVVLELPYGPPLDIALAPGSEILAHARAYLIPAHLGPALCDALGAGETGGNRYGPCSLAVLAALPLDFGTERRARLVGVPAGRYSVVVTDKGESTEAATIDVRVGARDVQVLTLPDDR